jgi:hypothetical protein
MGLLKTVTALAHELVASAHGFDRREGLEALREAAAMINIQAEVEESLAPAAYSLA